MNWTVAFEPCLRSGAGEGPSLLQLKHLAPIVFCIWASVSEI